MIRKNINNTNTQKGQSNPLGSSKLGDGVNFAIFSKHATNVTLEFFANETDEFPNQTVTLDLNTNKTGDIWHIWIAGIPENQIYAYRVEGPFLPAEGHRFDSTKHLIDPYCRAITAFDKSAPNTFPKSVYKNEFFDWENDNKPNHAWEKTVIYETHVRGLTCHESSKVQNPGSYLGLIEKISYFKELGVTAIELLPIFEFNHLQSGAHNPRTGKTLPNYWGYDTVCYFAPKDSYCSQPNRQKQIFEFKTMVKAFHKANIEIILDVVFNHTAEGNENGLTFCFKGLDNSIYYHLANEKQYYKNYAGTGNALNANQSCVKQFILDCLRYWVTEMHIDGFRFDLASLLNLDENGFLLTNSDVIDEISKDPILKNTKLIAEPWAPGAIYQVGNFGTRRWVEWNDRFRDDVRKFWRGDEGMLKFFAQRLGGSQDLFKISGKTPANSINFITCHDGFTLNDLVSYSNKHNNNNGHNNTDGTDQNYSNNYGIEGPTNQKEIESLRKKQIKNFLLSLFLSRGVPMLLGGDEFRRTQKGNNNAYCQDNEISWYNWNPLKSEKEIFDFVKSLIAFRNKHPIFSKNAFYSENEVEWFNPFGDLPNWDNATEKMLACLIHEGENLKIFCMFNAHSEGYMFKLPNKLSTLLCSVIIDTSDTNTPRNFDQPHEYFVNAQSSVILQIYPKTHLSY